MDTVLIIMGSAFGVMFSTMTSLMFVSMRVQHRDSTEIRVLIERSHNDSRDLIEQSNRENRDLIERSLGKLSAEFAEHKRVTEANHRSTQEQLDDVRERLGRIEGHLGIGMPSKTDDPQSD